MAEQGVPDGDPTEVPPDQKCQTCVQGKPATGWCRDCKKWLCTFCANFHPTQVDTAKHFIVPFLRDCFCHIHEHNFLKMFCFVCYHPICESCGVDAANCRNHDVGVMERVQACVKEEVAAVSRKQEEFEGYVQHIEKVINDADEEFEDCKADIRDVFNDAIERMGELKEHTVQILELKQNQSKRRGENEKNEVQQKLEKIRATVDKAMNLCQSKNSTEVVTSFKKLKDDMKEVVDSKWDMNVLRPQTLQLEHKPTDDYLKGFVRLIPKLSPNAFAVERVNPEVEAGEVVSFTVTVGAQDLDALPHDALKVDVTVEVDGAPPKEVEVDSVERVDNDNIWRVQFLPRALGTYTVDLEACKQRVPNAHRMVVDARKEIRPGTSVRRGRDWKWEDQDGGNRMQGRVVEVRPNNWVMVRWNQGKLFQKTFDYRWGAEQCFDLEIVQ